jgi:hypothetical protein
LRASIGSPWEIAAVDLQEIEGDQRHGRVASAIAEPDHMDAWRAV